jgi:hypothetical protein
VHGVVWRDAEDPHIVGTVVDLAHGEPVGHLGKPAFVPIGKDVRGIEQRLVLEPAHGALPAVGLQDG